VPSPLSEWGNLRRRLGGRVGKFGYETTELNHLDARRNSSLSMAIVYKLYFYHQLLHIHFYLFLNILSKIVNDVRHMNKFLTVNGEFELKY